MKRRGIRKIASIILCMAMLMGGLAVPESSCNVDAAIRTQEIYSQDFEGGTIFNKGVSGTGTVTNEAETKTNHYLELALQQKYVQVATTPISVEPETTYVLSYRIKVLDKQGSIYIRPSYQEWTDGDKDSYKGHDDVAPKTCIIQDVTDGWVLCAMEITPAKGKNYVQVFFEEAWAGGPTICLDDIKLRKKGTTHDVYNETFDTGNQLSVRSGADYLTQSTKKEEVEEFCVQMKGAGSSYSLKTNPISLEGGCEYRLTYKCKVSGKDGGVYFRPWYQEWLHSDNSDTGWKSVREQTPEACILQDDTNGWEEKEMVFIPASDKNYVQFFFEQAYSGTADICLDDIVITKVKDNTIVYQNNFDTKTPLNVHTDSTGALVGKGEQEFVSVANHYLKMSQASNSLQVKTPAFRVDSSKRYIFKYRAKIENVSGSIYFYPWYQEWYNDGTSEGPYTSVTNTPKELCVQGNTDGWVNYEMEIQPSSGKNYIYFLFELAWSGSADVSIDDVKLLEEIVTNEKMECAVSFANVDSDGTWHLNLDSQDSVQGQYFGTKLLVDGKECFTYFEKIENQLVVYSGFFKGEAPAKSVKMLKGTLLSQYDLANGKWDAPMENGEKLEIVNDLKVANSNGDWKNYDTEVTKTRYINLDAQKGDETILGTTETTPGTYVEESVVQDIQDVSSGKTSSIDAGKIGISLTVRELNNTSWSYTIEESIKTETASRYYKVPAKIDGNSMDVLVEIPAGQTYVEMYSHYFTWFGGSAPKSSFELEAGAIGVRVNPDTKEEVTGASLQIARDFALSMQQQYIHKQTVLYKTGDAHLDDTQPDDTDLDDTQPDNVYNSMDLVAMKKIAADTTDKTTDLAELRAADVNGSGKVDTTDLAALRGQLVGKTHLAVSKADASNNGVMPIIGYDGPDYDTTRVNEQEGIPANLITESVYSMIKDMGFNTIVADRNEIGTKDYLAYQMLQLAEDHGLRVYLSNGYISDYNNPEQVKSKDEFDAITQKYANYDSFAGYYIYDEPLKEKVPSLVDERACLPDLKVPFGFLGEYANLNGYLNLYPCNSSTLRWELDKDPITGVMKESSYKGYLREASKLGANYLSYDLYLRDNSYEPVKEAFYKNLKWTGEVAKEVKKPFYAFVQVGTDFEKDNSKKTPQDNLTTVQEMYLEANVALAMGAKGLNYYSLVQPIDYAKSKNGTYDYYRSGLINVKGEANHGEATKNQKNYDYYEAATKINSYVAKIDEVLMHADHKAVIATEKTVAEYVGGVTSYGSLTSVSCGDSVLVGCFDYYGREAYLVVSTSCDAGGVGKSQNVTLNFNTNTSYSYVGMDYNDNGHTGSGTLNLTNLGSGEAVLVVMDE